MRSRPTDEPREDASRRSLVRDQRGAIMVMGVFMAALLVGMIYYVSGLGETILYRERMQDAADAGAFGAAVLHARGMNLIALLNMVMGAILAVLVALKVLQDLLLAATVIATTICYFCSCPGCCGCCAACPLAVALEIGYEDVSSVIEAVEPIVEAVVTAASTAQGVIKTAYPLAAQAKVIEYGFDTYRKPTTAGFMYPFVHQLPVEDDDSDLLCRKAGEQAGRLLTPSILSIWPIRVFVSTSVGSLAATFSSHYCGDSADKAQRVPADYALGDDNFQLRAFMLGDPPYDETEQGVAVATWGQETSAGALEILRTAGKVSFAQSEFFFDGSADHKEWLWEMRWRARLRRFRMPDLGGASECGEACGALGGLTNCVVH